MDKAFAGRIGIKIDYAGMRDDVLAMAERAAMQYWRTSINDPYDDELVTWNYFNRWLDYCDDCCAFAAELATRQACDRCGASERLVQVGELGLCGSCAMEEVQDGNKIQRR